MKNKFIIPSFLLLLAIAPLPYGYYYILKFAVCIALIMEMVEIMDKKADDSNTLIIMGALVVLYNPLIAIPLGKIIWTIVNISTVIYLSIYSVNNKN